MANYFLLPIPQWLLNSGAINAGGLIYTYQASSTTPLATYTDSTGATVAANPVVLDSAGRAQIWLSAASYKFVVQTSAGAAIMTIDGYNPTNVNTTLSSLIDTGDLTLQQSTAATSGANQSSNNVKVQGTYWDGVTSQTDQWGIQDVLGTGSNPTSTLTVTHSGSSGTSTVSIPSVPVSLGNTLAVAGTTTLTGAVTLGSTINKLTLTQPASAATLTIANNKTFTANSSTTIAGVDGKTLTVNNSLTLAGTDSTTMTFPTTNATIARTDAGQTFTGVQVMSSPTINGTPTGTGIPTVTLKKGTGGGNYTSASTSDVAVDGTNLALTVTIPTGWKLAIVASGGIAVLTATVTVFVGLADGGTTVLTQPIAPAAITNFYPFCLAWEINGDGASHTIDLRYHTTNGADSVSINNASSTQLPTMVFILTPSN